MFGILLRLYGIPNCPHCETAVQYLMNAGLPQNSVHVVPVAGDPIIEAGIKAITGKDEVVVPILISFVSNPGEVIVGWRGTEYERIIKFIHTSISASTPDVSSGQGGDSAPGSGTPVETRPTDSVPSPVSSVPGDMGSRGSDGSSKPN